MSCPSRKEIGKAWEVALLLPSSQACSSQANHREGHGSPVNVGQEDSSQSCLRFRFLRGKTGVCTHICI